MFSGGSTAATTKTIAGTSDPELYQSERYAANFSYAIPASTGKYMVTLHFAEIYFTSTGSRVFNVLAEGTKVLNNFDIVATAGSFAAYKYSFPVSVNDGTINLDFQGVVQNAKVSAIEVLPASLTVQPSALNFGQQTVGQTSQAIAATAQNTSSQALSINSLGLFGADSASFTTTAKMPATIQPGQSLDIPVTFTPAHTGTHTATLEIVPQSPLDPLTVALNGSGAAVSTPPSSVLINSGGPAIVDSSGKTWTGDNGFSGGSTSSTTRAVSGSSNPALYQTERYGANFSYHLPLANGSYQITLHFAEIYFSAQGQRVFDVFSENVRVVSNLDIIASAGAFTAMQRSFTSQVSDGYLDLAFVSSIENAKVSAIEVGPAPVAPSNPPLLINAGGKSFTDTQQRLWKADSYFSGGAKKTTSYAIDNTLDDILYRSERTASTFSYRIPVSSAGTYLVKLHFCEHQFSTAGKRVFDVTAEGATVVSSLDIFAKAGIHSAYTQSFAVPVADGTLNLGFLGRIQSANVNGIEVQKQ